MRKKAQAVSIVIPVFNEEDYIAMCLDALAQQLGEIHEVIVVDNNSTDTTLKIIKRYPFVKLLHEKTQGVFYARNKGMNYASGDIIARIDADTVIEKDWVRRLKAAFKDSELMAITGPAGWYDMPGPKHNVRADILFKYPLYKYDKDFPFLFGTNMAVRKTAWNVVVSELCTSRTIHEDVDVAIHLYEHKLRILYDPKLRVMCSSRRFDDTFKNFRRYIRYYEGTYKHHHIKTVGIKVAVTVYTVGYIVLWPLRQSYNDKNRTRTLRQLFGPRNIARKDPMAER